MSINDDIYEALKKYTFPALLRDALNAAPSDVDKREGSILYDALAPLCMTLSKSFGVLHHIAMQSRFQTATGDYLDLCGSQFGIYRGQATHAKWKAAFTPTNTVIPVGHRFITAEGLGLEYEVQSQEQNGMCTLLCTTPGKDAGADFGALHPLPPIAGLKAMALVECIDAGADAQSDDAYRIKIWQGLQRTGFGGNFDDYKRWVFESFRDAAPEVSSAVAGFQMYPAWEGGGSVKLMVSVHGLYDDGSPERYVPAAPEVANTLKAFLDPIDEAGHGAGVVPIGHRVEVESPQREGVQWHVVVTCKAGYQVDAPMQSAITDAVKSHLADVRESALTTETGAYPWGGYQVKIIVNSLRSDIIYADRERIEDVQIFRRDAETGDFDEELGDEIFACSAQYSILPLLDVLRINDVTVFERT